MTTLKVPSGLSVELLSFHASSTIIITILPNFSCGPLYLLEGQYPDQSQEAKSIRPKQETTVPLWLAIHLKSIQQCSIIPPFWLKEKVAEEMFIEEKKIVGDLWELPHEQFFEIAYLLMDAMKEELVGYTKVKQLIEDLESLRGRKINAMLINENYPKRDLKLGGVGTGRDKEKEGVHGVTMKNITRYEVSKRRMSVLESIERFEQIKMEKGMKEGNKA